MIRTAHIIHTTGIGGVETAVDLIARTTQMLEYRVLAFAKDDPSAVQAAAVGYGVNSPRSLTTLLADLRRFKPEIVISSLWRSVIVGGLHRLTNPMTFWIVYIHNSRYTNPVDAIVHRVAFRFADRILCDSTAALEALVPFGSRSRAEVVRPDSALMQLARTQPGKNDSSSAVVPFPGRRRLVYWGRAVEQKRLDRALDLLSAIERRAPGRFAFDVICPRSDQLEGHLESARDRKLPMTWFGSRNAEEIAEIASSASFFLQLSEFEGLAMSVREALALGLVPVVTSVGEIGAYTEDGHDSIHVGGAEAASGGGVTPDDYADAATRIIALDEDPARLEAMLRAARTVVGGDFVADFEAVMSAAVGCELMSSVRPGEMTS